MLEQRRFLKILEEEMFILTRLERVNNRTNKSQQMKPKQYLYVDVSWSRFMYVVSAALKAPERSGDGEG